MYCPSTKNIVETFGVDNEVALLVRKYLMGTAELAFSYQELPKSKYYKRMMAASDALGGLGVKEIPAEQAKYGHYFLYIDYDESFSETIMFNQNTGNFKIGTVAEQLR